METQFALIDKLQRGGLTEKQYHILLEKATLPEEIESLEPTLEEVANEESEAKADVGDISQLKTPLNNLETERDDKTHIFQPRSQSARDIFNAIGTADADEVPQLQSDTDAQSQREEEEEERVLGMYYVFFFSYASFLLLLQPPSKKLSVRACVAVRS